MLLPGQLDPSFGHHGIGGGLLEPHYPETAFESVDAEPNGFLIAVRRGIMRRYSANGVLDTSFKPRKPTYPGPQATQPDGKVVKGGKESRLARLNPDGTLDPSFHGGESEPTEIGYPAE